jgi:hypothetical protein
MEDGSVSCSLWGVHPVEDENTCDQTDVNQWRFMVVPARDLTRGQNSMTLAKAMKRWPLIGWSELKSSVEQAIARPDLG